MEKQFSYIEIGKNGDPTPGFGNSPVIKSFARLFFQLSQEGTAADCIKRVNERGVFSLSHVAGFESVSACSGFIYDEVNFIGFNGAVTFYLVQDRSFCDGIFVPEHKLFIGRAASTVNRVRRVSESGLNISIERDKPAGPPASFYLSQSKPYHYFYDYFPVAHELMELVSNNCVSTTFEGAFLDVGSVYEREVSLLQDKRGIMFLEGYSVSLLRDKVMPRVKLKRSIKKFDSFLRERSSSLVTQALVNEFEHSKNVVWLGISLRRPLIEQVYFINCFLTACRQKLGSLWVLVDGFTSSAFPSEKSIITKSTTSQFNSVLNELELTGDRVTLLHGYDSISKIYLASKCKLFFSEAGTASLYPGRFCSKPGLTYGSEKKRYSRHENINGVYVDGARANISKTWILDSIIIDKDLFHRELERLLLRLDSR